jgi:hypothetical protein
MLACESKEAETPLNPRHFARNTRWNENQATLDRGIVSRGFIVAVVLLPLYGELQRKRERITGQRTHGERMDLGHHFTESCIHRTMTIKTTLIAETLRDCT